MPLLRRAWLVALAAVAALGGGCALLMRSELRDPGPTLSQELYTKAFAIHAVAMLGMFVGALITLPTQMLARGRATVALGSVAFVVWAATGFLLAAGLAFDMWSDAGLRAALCVLGVAAALAVVQVLASLRANADKRSHTLVASGSIIALVVVAISLARGKFPPRLDLLIAGTVAVGSMIPMALESNASTIVWIAAAPCLATAWITSAMLEAVHAQFLPDTVAMLSPLPALGAAMLAAVFIAVGAGRALSRRAYVAAVVFSAGSIATSTGFLLLGLQGMPRRYQQYDPGFQPLQLFVGLAAAVTVIGALLAVRSTRPK